MLYLDKPSECSTHIVQKFGFDCEVNFPYDGGLMKSIWMLSLPITIFNTGRRPTMTPSFYCDRNKTINDPCKECVQNNAQNNENNKRIEWDILPYREYWHMACNSGATFKYYF